jgi:ankyrin repeat domain-containing protein 50
MHRFRWAECQLIALKRCKRSERCLEECLQSLPRGLDETYERMLCNIDKDSAEDARRMLMLLCFSARPLTVDELIDGMAVNLTEPACLNYRDRVEDAESLLEICPGLIQVDVDVQADVDVAVEDCDREQVISTVRIAHFSVQEYLESTRIPNHNAAPYALSSGLAHEEIANICCVYLSEPNLSNGELSWKRLREFPLARFAAEYWYHHYRNSTGNKIQTQELVLRIFEQEKCYFHTWVRIYDIDKPWKSRDFTYPSNAIPSPVYYASMLGLELVLDKLTGKEDFNLAKRLVNAQGGQYGTALQAASSQGHESIVQKLLDNGAEVNAQGGDYGTALQAASYKGHESIVQKLLDNGAEVNAQGGHYGTALQAALYEGHESIVQKLFDNGADINTQGGFYGTALQAALEGGHDSIISKLRDRGAKEA